MGSSGNITLARTGLRALEVLGEIEDRTPDPAQRAALADWPGWGPFAPAFDSEPEGTWAVINERLAQMLTAEEMTSAADCVDNAFYTSPDVVDAVYAILTRAGFSGGRVLEPGCGSGRFLSRAPADLPCEFVGVERDLISARIAAALHPHAQIIQGAYEQVSPAGEFDVVVGNVPFSGARVYDRALDISDNLHNYFIRRSVALLREGGYLAVVTSRYSLDSKSNVLNALADEADFVGALRLPTGAFHDEGTDVVVDVVVMRKNTTRPRRGWRPVMVEPGTRAGECYVSAFLPGQPGSYSYARQSDGSVVHSYWAAHPQHVAGVMAPSSHWRNALSVTYDGPLAEALTGPLSALLDVVDDVPMFDPPRVAAADDLECADDAAREGSFQFAEDGSLRRVESRALVPVRASAELLALVKLRDLAQELLTAEADIYAPAESMAGLRQKTLEAYQGYVGKYGPLNRGTLHEGAVDAETGLPSLSWKRPRLGGFRKDPDYVTVMALEKFDQDTGVASPAPILLRRVNAAPEPVESADSPEEALSITLGESGHVDLSRVAGLLDLDGAEHAQDALGDLVFCDPQQGGQVVRTRDYLSGDVRAKLAAAEVAAASDERYSRNVDALRQVVPADLGPLEIRMNLGNPCLESSDISAFICEVVGGSASVTHSPATASWEVEPRSKSQAAITTWGTERLNAYQLISCALNGKAPVVYDEVIVSAYPRKVRKVRNADQTIAAQEKLNALHERFNVWVWEDAERTARLCQVYNRRFNSYVPRVDDGSYLTFPGMSGVMDPYTWQRDMVDRVVSTPGALCGHCVGAGKTLTMALSAVTLRRFGLARKPLVVVPNHLLEQIAREMQQAFPLGRFLIASKDDLAGDARRLFAARCATGDWDAVVMTHQGFTSLPVHPITEQRWLRTELAKFDVALRTESGGYFGAKEIARKKRSLESRLAKLRTDQRTDVNQVLFEHLGVDYIMVDEAQVMKRLPVASRSEGFSMGSSKRATDLLVKAEALAQRRPGTPYLSLFTGTPWTNTLAETYVWQRFLQPEALESAGVSDFDAWAAVFVKRETVVEVAPDGSGYRTATRPTRMTNIPELKAMLHQVADIRTADDIGLERPQRVLNSVVVKPTRAQQHFVASLVRRSEKLSSGSKEGNDNMLVICGEGRRLALDPALVGVAGGSPKVSRAADEVATVYRDTMQRRYPGSDTPGSFQIVFCDQGTPSATKGGQTYKRCKDALVKAGIPAQRIRMIHEAKDDKSRAALFAACRDGSVSVLIGSTEKLGTGTNIQSRLSAIHHLDAPWRASDIEQREGRGLRPGNGNESVSVYRYVTERTFDAYMWQALERKALGFAVMYSRDLSLREVDDIGEIAPDYTQMKALASGDPLLLEQAELVTRIKKLRTLRAVDAQSLTTARKRVEETQQRLIALGHRLDALDRYVDQEDTNEERPELIERLVRDVRRTLGQSYGRPHARCWLPWRGLQLELEESPFGDLLLILRADHRAVGEVVVNANTVLRGKTSKATRHLEELARHWVEQVDDLMASLRRDARHCQSSIDEAQHVIDTYSFARQDELDATAARLRDVQAKIAESADQTESAA